MEQKYNNKLFLLKKIIEKIPFTYPESKKKEYEDELHRLESQEEVDPKEVDSLIVKIGKESWPQRQSYEEMVKNYAQDKLEEFFKMHLEENLRKKYEEFTKKGYSIIDNYRYAKEFDDFFTAEENLKIEDALFDARDELAVHMRGVIKSHRDEFEELVRIYEKKRETLSNMIANLRLLADKSEKWSAEIIDKVNRFEEGWSVIERDFDEDKIMHEIEYWQGVIGEE